MSHVVTFGNNFWGSLNTSKPTMMLLLFLFVASVRLYTPPEPPGPDYDPARCVPETQDYYVSHGMVPWDLDYQSSQIVPSARRNAQVWVYEVDGGAYGLLFGGYGFYDSPTCPGAVASLADTWIANLTAHSLGVSSWHIASGTPSLSSCLRSSASFLLPETVPGSRFAAVTLSDFDSDSGLSLPILHGGRFELGNIDFDDMFVFDISTEEWMNYGSSSGSAISHHVPYFFELEDGSMSYGYFGGIDTVADEVQYDIVEFLPNHGGQSFATQILGTAHGCLPELQNHNLFGYSSWVEHSGRSSELRSASLYLFGGQNRVSPTTVYFQLLRIAVFDEQGGRSVGSCSVVPMWGDIGNGYARASGVSWIGFGDVDQMRVHFDGGIGFGGVQRSVGVAYMDYGDPAFAKCYQETNVIGLLEPFLSKAVARTAVTSQGVGAMSSGKIVFGFGGAHQNGSFSGDSIVLEYGLWCYGKMADDPSVCSSDGVCVAHDTCLCDSEVRGDECDVYNCSTLHGCQEHGECVAPHTCDCYNDTRWTGVDCGDAVCFGMLASNLEVCNRNGSCISPDQCQCFDEGVSSQLWGGLECDEPVCYKYGEGRLLETCSGHGVCVSPGQCICSNYSEYRGVLCDSPLCNGLENGDVGICNDRGVCYEFDLCACEQPFGGPFCGEVVCFDLVSSDPDVCGGHGDCLLLPSNGTDVSYCLCDNYERFKGENCDLPVCDDACELHGSCVGVDNCTCDDDMQYTGFYCNISVCNGTRADDANVCSGNGTCIAYDVCNCTDPFRYAGFICEEPICSRGTFSTCDEHGTCVDPDVCRCDNNAEYTGPRCDLAVCSGAFGPAACSGPDHGFCESPEVCECVNGYSGGDCLSYDCAGVSGCNSHGGCDGPETCDCDDGFFPPDCTTWDCLTLSNCSGHGSCVSDQNCDCFDTGDLAGYSGMDCSAFDCNGVNGCHGHGNCIAPDTCVCTGGYFGDECADFTCGHFCDILVHSTCVAPNFCSCSDGYEGDTCEDFDCLGQSDCSGHGTCVAPDVCDCGLYTTSDCSEWNCGVWNRNSPAACSAHGGCVAPDTCTCDPGYTRSDCGDWTCFGTSRHLILEVCSARGTCDDLDTCGCSGGFSGFECDEWSCSTIDKDDDFVCNDRGTCSSPDLCECEDGFTGDDCQGITCYGVNDDSPSVCNSAGYCFLPNLCQCYKVGHYGGACDEVLELSIFVRGLVTDRVLTFTIKYHSPSSYLLAAEPFGAHFGCRDRIFADDENAAILGEGAICGWVGDGADVVGLNLTVSDPSAAVFRNGFEGTLRLALLSSTNSYERAFIKILVDLEDPNPGLSATSLGALVGSLVTVGLIVIVVVVVLSVVLVVVVVKRRAAVRDLAMKHAELTEVTEAAIHSTMKLEEDMRKLQTTIAKLPDEYVRIDDIGTIAIAGATDHAERVNLRMISLKADWNGHPVILKKFDPDHEVSSVLIDETMQRAKAIASLPHHDHVRRYYAYYLGDSNECGFLVEPAGMGVIDYMWNKKRSGGVVTIEQKIKWMIQLAKAIHHLSIHDVYAKNLHVRCLRVNAEGNMKIDVPWVPPKAQRSPFAAPEVVRMELGEIDEDQVGSEADVYSFGVLFYCILVETRRPYRFIADGKNPPKNGRLGVAAANDCDFRPSLEGLPSWTTNLLAQLWDEDASSRPEISFLLDSVLESLYESFAQSEFDLAQFGEEESSDELMSSSESSSD